ncbi:MAG: (Fe-S)-binding protein [Desulfobacterium sp.]
MAELKNLASFKEEIEKCVKCGACRAYCPVFGVERREGRVARGKVTLAQAILQGEVPLQGKLLEDLSQCLLCGSCHVQCPNKVPTEEIVAAARRHISEQNGLSAFGKAMSAVLGRQKVMDTLMQTGGRMNRFLFKKLPKDSGLRLRFPGSVFFPDRTLPALSTTSFRERVPERIKGKRGKPTVVFFTGCGINYLFPEIGEAMLKILHFMGVTVIIPKEQVCCGFPAVSAGAKNTVEGLAEQNLATLKKYPADYIVTACASCHAGLTRIYSNMGDEFKALANKTEDICVFLMKNGLPEKLASFPQVKDHQAKEKINVTYHDPCHLRNSGITREPRAILKVLSRVNYIEMPEAGTCCGLGGTYSVYHYDTSKKIGAKKARHIANSGADWVATDCPGCIIQLNDSINHAALPQKSVHILELIAREIFE